MGLLSAEQEQQQASVTEQEQQQQQQRNKTEPQTAANHKVSTNSPKSPRLPVSICAQWPARTGRSERGGEPGPLARCLRPILSPSFASQVKQRDRTFSPMAESTYQFSCPSCGALLQAVLKQALTSVQCGECFDVFDVQMPNLCASATTQAEPWPWLLCCLGRRTCLSVGHLCLAKFGGLSRADDRPAARASVAALRPSTHTACSNRPGPPLPLAKCSGR